MRFIIVNSHRTPLTSFHSNGGWDIKDVFPCSRKCYMFFSSEAEAQEHLDYIIGKCEKERYRWGNWTDKALEFAHKLTVSSNT